jgi:hypothetical protein
VSRIDIPMKMHHETEAEICVWEQAMACIGHLGAPGHGADRTVGGGRMRSAAVDSVPSRLPLPVSECRRGT